MLVQAPAVPAPYASSLASPEADGFAAAMHRCGVLRGLIRDCGLAAGMLREAAERLQERAGWPDGTLAERHRHAAAEATGLWRAAWALCAVSLPSQPGGEAAMQALDAAGSALAADAPSCIPSLAVAATALERLRQEARQILAQRLDALDRQVERTGPLAGTDLVREATRLRALQARQNLAGRVIGLGGLIPDCLRDDLSLADGTARPDAGWSAENWPPSDWGLPPQPLPRDTALWR